MAPFAVGTFWPVSDRPSPVSLLRTADGSPRGDESPSVNLILSCGSLSMTLLCSSPFALLQQLFPLPPVVEIPSSLLAFSESRPAFGLPRPLCW